MVCRALRKGECGVKTLVSFQELDALGEKLIREYFRKTRCRNAMSVDIEGFMTEFLGMTVLNRRFATKDPNKIGFCGDGIHSLPVWAGDHIEETVFPEGTVVIEQELLRPDESGRRRYTLAHEAAHEILRKHVPLQAAECFFTSPGSDPGYSVSEYRRIHSYNEICANRLGAALLMPGFLMEKAIEKFNNGEHVIYYDGGIFSQTEKLKIGKMINALGVSFSAFVNRLRELDLIDRHPFAEYMTNELHVGGNAE